MYQLKFLPLARQDMTAISRYISHELHNPTAAEKLAVKMIEAAESLTDFPYKNAIHQPVKPLKKEFRKQKVKNYFIFYWVDEKEKTITIARVIYARRDYEKLL